MWIRAANTKKHMKPQDPLGLTWWIVTQIINYKNYKNNKILKGQTRIGCRILYFGDFPIDFIMYDMFLSLYYTTSTYDMERDEVIHTIESIAYLPGRGTYFLKRL